MAGLLPAAVSGRAAPLQSLLLAGLLAAAMRLEPVGALRPRDGYHEEARILANSSSEAGPPRHDDCVAQISLYLADGADFIVEAGDGGIRPFADKLKYVMMAVNSMLQVDVMPKHGRHKMKWFPVPKVRKRDPDEKKIVRAVLWAIQRVRDWYELIFIYFNLHKDKEHRPDDPTMLWEMDHLGTRDLPARFMTEVRYDAEYTEGEPKQDKMATGEDFVTAIWILQKVGGIIGTTYFRDFDGFTIKSWEAVATHFFSQYPPYNPKTDPSEKPITAQYDVDMQTEFQLVVANLMNGPSEIPDDGPYHMSEFHLAVRELLTALNGGLCNHGGKDFSSVAGYKIDHLQPVPVPQPGIDDDIEDEPEDPNIANEAALDAAAAKLLGGKDYWKPEWRYVFQPPVDEDNVDGDNPGR
eukprot:CAMPEP_0178405152 /NCGR_PEP_ID=MMETSP0689_2-20121128/18253_1 /TAXON_ID=160604 /ORGANISM="Amphidinium massartii, Strain CS-259" /LENGTH=409 /DNA_ID=CAMNT_0020026161 /DNA_START=153 /DNA_END=1382 /DNA_ORIENTATION=+